MTDPAVIGYRAYYGTATLLTVGNVRGFVEVPSTSTSLEFTPGTKGLTVGTTLHMVVSALGSNGLESPVSEQALVVLE